ncbi:MAG: DUF2905 family protein [Gemmatales bacterium]|nr:DUF2905 domain-containing protein [Gemmatales bacterium]MCS7158945.1 DUF2905 domain-containing protein [Gemmatales bacterium]MDW8174145.1 DUF2905 family protein [Gemmatales bacterium]MDW8222396.1 DUF2905 family protein [Gemmatales bacterium]
MNPMQGWGWMLIVMGVALVLVGVVLVLSPKVPGLGRLPGDLVIERDGVRIYIPITTSLLLSALLTLLLWVVQWFGRR